MKWPTVPLARVVLVNPKDDDHQGLSDDTLVSFVPMSAVSEDGFGITDRVVKRLGDVRRGYSAFKNDDVLFAKITPCMENGKSAVATDLENTRGFGSTEFHVLRAGSSLLPDFLHYFLRQKSFRLLARQHMRGGAGQQRVPADFLQKEAIPLPPLSEQRRIVEILDQADRLRRLRDKANAKAERILPALFTKMFGDSATNPMGWQCRPLSDLASKLSDGPFGSNLKTSHYTADGVRVLRLQNVGVGTLLDDDKAFVSLDHFASLSKHQCLPGDVIVATLGDPNLRACVLPTHVPQALNKADCVQIRPKPGIAVAEYICWLLNAPGTVQMAERLMHGQTRTRISMGLLKGLLVPVPHYELQICFASHAQAATQAIAKREKLNENITTLWKVLLHAAFTQQLTASWREAYKKELLREMER